MSPKRNESVEAQSNLLQTTKVKIKVPSKSPSTKDLQSPGLNMKQVLSKQSSVIAEPQT